MTLTTLLLSIAVVAFLLTLIAKMAGKTKNLFLSYLQNFCGALFIFSGWVKAVDPLGTAYKMEQYFAEFETLFDGTFLSFISPIFPFLAGFVVAFSVFMIVFEIVLGVMLLLGARPRLTAWSFLLLVLFFTALTGFTYLTGYVPEDVTFFEFGKWGEYIKSNMKVTDCGCFGDFLVLEPRTSFLKDVFLLVPAFIFVFMTKSMHQWFNKGVRTAAIVLTLAGITIYSMSNYVWDIPHADFRPFRKGVNMVDQKAKEQEAMENIDITYQLTNKSSGTVEKMPMDQYMKVFKDYPKADWDIDQIKGEPAVAQTKISEFEVSDVEGNDVTEELLSNPNYSIMIVAYKLYSESSEKTVTVQDSVYVIDTLKMQDTFQLVRRLDKILEKKVNRDVYTFNESYTAPWTNVINPMAEQAMTKGYKVFGVTKFADAAEIEDFRHHIQSPYPIYTADDILLKTIVRSNPGVVLLKNGTIVNKWHYKQLPPSLEAMGL